jgi:phosphate transport system permease protein
MSEIDKLEVEAERDPFKDVDFAELETSLYRPRTFLSILLSWIVALMTFMALVPLFAVLWKLILRGGKRLSLTLFAQLPPAPLEHGGGFGNAIVGTVIMVGIAALSRFHLAFSPESIWLSQKKADWRRRCASRRRF